MTEDPKPNALPIPVGGSHNSAMDRGGNRVMLYFWVGILVASCLYAVALLATLATSHRFEPVVSPLIDGLVIPFGDGLCLLLLGTLFLGLTMWARLKIVKEVRYAKARTAFITGLIFDLLPLPLVRLMSDRASVVLAWTALVWVVFFPVAAGFWLCYRADFRD